MTWVRMGAGTSIGGAGTSMGGAGTSIGGAGSSVGDRGESTISESIDAGGRPRLAIAHIPNVPPHGSRAIRPCSEGLVTGVGADKEGGDWVLALDADASLGEGKLLLLAFSNVVLGSFVSDNSRSSISF